MGITYESICEKLGFDPLIGNPQKNKKTQDSWLIDDSRVSPYSLLTEEESDFLMELFIKRREK